MSVRNTIIVLALLLVVGGYALYANHQPLPEKTPKVYKIAAKDIKKIDLKSPDREIVLERAKNGSWNITRPVKSPAEQAVVDSLADQISGVEITGTAEEHPADLAPFGLADPGVIVTVTATDNKTLPAVMVGKPAPIGNSTFIKTADKPAVLMVSSTFGAELNKHVDDLRSRAAFTFKPDDSLKIAITRGSQSLELDRSGDTWTIRRPQNYPADKEAVTALLNTLDNARAVDFIDDRAPDAAKYGLENPSLQVTLEGPSHTTETLSFGFKQPEASSNGIYARSSYGNDRPVYTLTNDVFASANKSFDDLRDKTVLRFDPARVGRISFAGGPVDEVIAQAAKDKWTVSSSGKTAPAELPVAQSLIDQLHDLKAEKIVEDPMTDPKRYGMVTPTIKVTLAEQDGKPIGEIRASTLEVTVKPPDSDQKPETRAFGYATTSRDEAVYQISAESVRDLENTANRLQSDVTPAPSASASPTPASR
jgi:hypothetical protein